MCPLLSLDLSVIPKPEQTSDPRKDLFLKALYDGETKLSPEKASVLLVDKLHALLAPHVPAGISLDFSLAKRNLAARVYEESDETYIFIQQHLEQLTWVLESSSEQRRASLVRSRESKSLDAKNMPDPVSSMPIALDDLNRCSKGIRGVLVEALAFLSAEGDFFSPFRSHIDLMAQASVKLFCDDNSENNLANFARHYPQDELLLNVDYKSTYSMNADDKHQSVLINHLGDSGVHEVLFYANFFLFCSQQNLSTVINIEGYLTERVNAILAEYNNKKCDAAERKNLFNEAIKNLKSLLMNKLENFINIEACPELKVTENFSAEIKNLSQEFLTLRGLFKSYDEKKICQSLARDNPEFKINLAALLKYQDGLAILFELVEKGRLPADILLEPMQIRQNNVPLLFIVFHVSQMRERLFCMMENDQKIFTDEQRLGQAICFMFNAPRAFLDKGSIFIKLGMLPKFFEKMVKLYPSFLRFLSIENMFEFLHGRDVVFAAFIFLKEQNKNQILEQVLETRPDFLAQIPAPASPKGALFLYWLACFKKYDLIAKIRDASPNILENFSAETLYRVNSPYDCSLFYMLATDKRGIVLLEQIFEKNPRLIEQISSQVLFLLPKPFLHVNPYSSAFHLLSIHLKFKLLREILEKNPGIQIPSNALINRIPGPKPYLSTCLRIFIFANQFDLLEMLVKKNPDVLKNTPLVVLFDCLSEGDKIHWSVFLGLIVGNRFDFLEQILIQNPMALKELPKENLYTFVPMYGASAFYFLTCSTEGTNILKRIYQTNIALVDHISLQSFFDNVELKSGSNRGVSRSAFHNLIYLGEFYFLEGIFAKNLKLLEHLEPKALFEILPGSVEAKETAFDKLISSDPGVIFLEKILKSKPDLIKNITINDELLHKLAQRGKAILALLPVDISDRKLEDQQPKPQQPKKKRQNVGDLKQGPEEKLRGTLFARKPKKAAASDTKEKKRRHSSPPPP